MPSIAIFRTGSAGEVILASVAINLLQQMVPDADIHWFGKKITAEFIAQAYPFVHIHEIRSGVASKTNFETIKRAATGFDIIIDLQRSARTMILGLRAALHFKCPYITWNKYSIHRSLLVLQSRIRTRVLHIDLMPGFLTSRHLAMAKCTARALQKLGIEIPESIDIYKPSINTRHNRIPKTIAVNLGALYAAKELPLYKLKQVLSYIINNNVATEVYFLGDEKKQATANSLAGEYNGIARFHNLCGKTTLWEAACVLATCEFSVSNDTALAHLSESVNTPVLMFFGPTHEKFGYRPHLPLSKSFSTDISCRPCTKDGNTHCRYGDFKCLNDIELEPVFEQISFLHSLSK